MTATINGEEAAEVTVEFTVMESRCDYSEFGVCMLLLALLLWLLAAFCDGSFNREWMYAWGGEDVWAPGERWCHSRSSFLNDHYITVHKANTALEEMTRAPTRLECRCTKLYKSVPAGRDSVPCRFQFWCRKPLDRCQVSRSLMRTTGKERQLMDSQQNVCR
jgi:hypothetical protein